MSLFDIPLSVFVGYIYDSYNFALGYNNSLTTIQSEEEEEEEEEEEPDDTFPPVCEFQFIVKLNLLKIE